MQIDLDDASDPELLYRIRSHLLSYSPVTLTPGQFGDRGCASVAIILRLRDAQNVTHVARMQTLDPARSDGQRTTPCLEIMFMKRSINPRDRWSGHVRHRVPPSAPLVPS
jgi:hypothetical protein